MMLAAQAPTTYRSMNPGDPISARKKGLTVGGPLQKGAEKNAAVLFIFPLWGKYGRRPGRGLTGAVIQIGRIAGAPAAAIR
jgi:hypothetical protein